MDLGALDEDALVVGYPVLNNLVRVTKVGGLEFLITVEIGECAHQRSSSSLGNPP